MISRIPVLFADANFLEIIVPFLIFAVFYILKFIGNRKNAGNSDSQQGTANQEDAGERVQKIREEIARRMAEKKQKTPAPAQSAALQTQSQSMRTQSTHRAPAPPPPVPGESVVDRQAALLAELEKAKKSVLASQQRVEALLNAGAGTPAPAREYLTETLDVKTPALAFLKNKETLRASIVVREILSPPLSLRSER